MACSSSEGASGSGDLEDSETGTSSAGSEGETAAHSESGPGDGDPPPGCEEPASGGGQPFALALGDFPGADEFELELELECEVLSVAIDGGMISTALECIGDDAAVHPAVLDVRAPDEGSAAWGADEAVMLSVRAVAGYGGLIDDPTPLGYDVQYVALHRVADGMLLAAGTKGPGVAPMLYAPVQVTSDRDACGVDVPEADYPGPNRNMAVTFELDDEELTLLGGQAGSLSVGDDWLALDVTSATAMECCHGDRWIVTVARLMTAG